MKNSYFLLFLSLLFLTACTHPQQALKVKPNTQTLMGNQEFQEFREESGLSDNFYVGETQDNVARPVVQSSTTVEPMPNFQLNDFKSVKTANRANIKKDLKVSGGNVKVNVESIPLNEFVDFIFSSVLKMNYTVDKSIKKMQQPITLNMAKTLPKKQLLTVVENILKSESVGLNQEDGTLFISQVSKSKSLEGLSDRYIVLGRELSPNLKDSQKVLVFTPFYYSTPKELSTFARRLGINKVKINPLGGNILALKGEAFDVREVLELVNIIDVPSMDKKVPYLVELEYIGVKKFAEQMSKILKSNSIPIAANIRELGMVLTPIEEINTLLVLSSKDSWIEMLRFWKNKLDVMSELDNEHAQLYIYKVQHRKSDELAEILQNVLGEQKNSQNVPERSVEPDITFSVENNQTANNSASTKTAMNIQADLHTNSLMLNVTPAEYKRILPIVKRLDTLPLQVAVEVTLAEVDMTNTFNLGFEWTILNNKAVSATPTQVSGAHTLGLGGSAGLTSSLFTNNLTSLINAYAEEKKLEILSRPRLVILNNKTGNINVGQQVPTVSSEASASDLTTNGSSILRNISYVTTGMTLNLTPTINSNGILTLDISVVLSEAQTNSTSSIDSPLIVNRSLTTSAVMQSGNSLLLGGIISHNKSDGYGGVPLLQDLPWVGDLFKAQSSSHVKTELIILIKPKILKNSKELFEETQSFELLLTNLRKTINF